MKHLKSFHIFESEKFDYKTTDLKADYDMLNDKMFDGKLKPVPLRWMRTKYKLGVMAYTETGKIEYVGISYFYVQTRQQYLNVLAHEMIHVYLDQTGANEKDAHGYKFMFMLKALNEKFPEFNITKSDNAADFTVGVSGGDKTYGVVLIDEDGKLSLVAVQAKLFTDTVIDVFIDELTKYTKSPGNVFQSTKSLKIGFYKSSHPDIPKFKIKKSLSLRSMELYVITDEMAAEIRQEEPIKLVNIK